MSAPATQQPPSIPPRPSRTSDKDAMPKVPPRPITRSIDRSVSPNPHRYAPSPLNDGPFLPILPKSPRSQHFSSNNGYRASNESAGRSSVDLPSLGEEGAEYAGIAQELQGDAQLEAVSSPEHTRTVGEDVQLHAPKPSLPAQSAKARVAAVTRTDSDRAASYGIGKPSSEEPLPGNRSLKKKASTVSQLSATESHVDDEQGIPEIGKQVPMYPNAGDVQAPSPAPAELGSQDSLLRKPKHHSRRTSARGFVELPPGSYGLHGHGILSQDKLEKAYYDKHPELRVKEHTPYQPDRVQDFSMSRDDLNKIVRDTRSQTPGNGQTQVYAGTPSEQIGWQAIEETTSRVSSVRPESAEAKHLGQKSPAPKEDETYHIEDPGARRRSVMFSDDDDAIPEEKEERDYHAPILAEDEVIKRPTSSFEPAVELGPERRGSAFEMEEPRSRPTSRPTSIYKEPLHDIRSTPLEDVQEYEPLFPEEEKDGKSVRKTAPGVDKKDRSYTPRFPSRDVWEDAPPSSNYMAEVSTPEPGEAAHKPPEVPPRETSTPAHAFAKQQEELAERELNADQPEHFLHQKQKQKKSDLGQHQFLTLSPSEGHRESLAPRFPSRDVWEDTPDSLQLEATVSTPQQDATSPVEAKPQVPQRPQKKLSDPSTAPAIPERPKRKLSANEDEGPTTVKSPPSLPSKPKPEIPARPARSDPAVGGEIPSQPAKADPTTGGQEPGEAAAPPPRTKPAVPARPVGSKIAALQAGFMSDLNNRLKLGPQAPKKEEPAVEPEAASEQEKAPLADARKGRARGPQRRAPKASPSPAAGASATELARDRPVLSFSSTCTVFSLDPDTDHVTISSVALTEAEGHVPDANPATHSPTKQVEEEEPTQQAEPSEGPASGGEKIAEKIVTPAEKPEDEHTERVRPDSPAEKHAEIKSLATNMAGETLIETHLQEDAHENVKEGEAEEGQKN